MLLLQNMVSEIVETYFDGNSFIKKPLINSGNKWWGSKIISSLSSDAEFGGNYNRHSAGDPG